jgi:hypothetical protein
MVKIVRVPSRDHENACSSASRSMVATLINQLATLAESAGDNAAAARQ